MSAEVAVNEWGVPEPTPAQEAHAEDVGTQAGCEYVTCPQLTICDPCGLYVCYEHTTGSSECVDGGLHHDRCITDCKACADQIARDLIDEQAIDYAIQER